MIKKLLIIALSLPLYAFAHEGHNQTPGSLKTLHGGLVIPGKVLNLETMISGQDVTLYPTSHEGSDIAPASIKLEARALPKRGKPYPVIFTSTKDGFKTKVDLKGANRLPIEVNVLLNGKSDKFTVQVEE